MMTDPQSYNFTQEPTGRWYIDLPEWPGDRAELEMVIGADTMLNMVAEGNNKVQLLLAEQYFDGATEITLIEDLSNNIGGGNYLLQNYNGEAMEQEIWLCPVTEFVFGHLPPVIYFKKVA